MSLGVKMGFNNYNFNLNELSINDINDPAFLKSDGAFSPNFGVGIYYAQPEFYVGVSTPKLFENNYAYSIPKDGLSLEKRHFYLIGGGLVPLTANLQLMPTSLVKITPGAPIEADFSANFLLYERFLIGAMYRTGDAIGLMAGFYITEQFSAGYSYDWSFVNKTGRHNYGSHEVVLRYDLVFGEKRRIRSPRYFCKY
jgi:type IX secretion system PorP/SprF family membrane protein